MLSENFNGVLICFQVNSTVFILLLVATVYHLCVSFQSFNNQLCLDQVSFMQ